MAIIGRLLRAGADPDARDASGETLLMIAVRSGNIDSVAALVERGAAVNASDMATQTTPLMWAVRSNSLPAVKLLIEHGATVDTRHVLARRRAGFRRMPAAVRMALGSFAADGRSAALVRRRPAG